MRDSQSNERSFSLALWFPERFFCGKFGAFISISFVVMPLKTYFLVLATR